ALCLRLRDQKQLAVITNDIYTREDAEFLTRRGALAPDRVIGVETGGCPHTAIREDASVNLEAVRELERRFPNRDLLLIESGGDEAKDRSCLPTSAMAKEPALLSNGSAANCCLRPERVGRDGSLSLRFGRRASNTVMTGCRFELPLQVLAPIQQPDGSAYVLL